MRSLYFRLAQRDALSPLRYMCRAIESRQTAILWAIAASCLAGASFVMWPSPVVWFTLTLGVICATRARSNLRLAGTISASANAAADEFERETAQRRRERRDEHEAQPIPD